MYDHSKQLCKTNAKIWDMCIKDKGVLSLYGQWNHRYRFSRVNMPISQYQLLQGKGGMKSIDWLHCIIRTLFSTGIYLFWSLESKMKNNDVYFLIESFILCTEFITDKWPGQPVAEGKGLGGTKPQLTPYKRWHPTWQNCIKTYFR